MVLGFSIYSIWSWMVLAFFIYSVWSWKIGWLWSGLFLCICQLSPIAMHKGSSEG